MRSTTFAQTVNTGTSYHVFLTPEGDCQGLYVKQKTPNSFEVQEVGGGKSNVAFDYRITALRKGHEAVRLADVTKQFSASRALRAADPRGCAGHREYGCHPVVIPENCRNSGSGRLARAPDRGLRVAEGGGRSHVYEPDLHCIRGRIASHSISFDSRIALS